MERKKKKDVSKFYIAVLCCAVIIAIVGYANRVSLKEETPTKENELSQLSPSPKAEQIIIEEKKEQSEPKDITDTQQPVNKNVQTEEKIQFNAPVSGNIIGEFSGEDLIYNETLKDWRSHSGVDFSAGMGEQVFCSANGIVEAVFDSGLGRCVTIDHQNGFKTLYANLNEDTKLSKGDEIAQGDVIGTVGNTALGDLTEEAHLHFEMLQNNIPVNPADFLN